MKTNKILKHIFSYPKIPSFADETFQAYHIQSDRVMIFLLILQWFLSTFITSIYYETYLYGFVGGALITVPIVLLFPYLKGERFYRYYIAVGMMLFSVIYIQQYLGRIEMHFHVFIALAVLTLYKDIVPIIIAATTTILHHLIFNYLQLYEVSLFGMPVMVFNYGCGLDIVILHGIFVLLELLVISYIIRLEIEHSINLNHTQNEVYKLNNQLEYTSLHDSLTGLPNRLHLNNKINGILQDATQKEEKVAVIFLDLDHFKNINDTLGHNVGDALLQTVANILKKHVQQNSLISRIGGDEFIITIYGFKDEEILLPLINDIVKDFRKEYIIKGYSLRLSASIGISIFPDYSQNINELMKYADIAMYQAKADGRDNFHFFTQALNNKIHNEVDIINDMQRALYDNEFQLYFQPKIDTQTNKVIGAEALLRWVHYEKGMIGPNIFIPLAENTGFILNLGSFVIQESVKSIKKFSDMGYDDLMISLNVSTRQFQNSDLYEELKNELETHNINPKQLGIEITESVMMEYIDKTLETLKAIKQLGISIYIDDFGTGYSSLAYLKKFPIDVLKIDKSFIDDISGNEVEDEKCIINTILAMGKSLHLKVVAEGVETSKQYEFLRRKECEMVQGYYFAKPMNIDDFLNYVKQTNSI